MARYDQGWGPQGNRYDEPFRNRGFGQGPGGGARGGVGPAPWWGYDQDFGGGGMGPTAEPGMRGFQDEVDAGMYGPARYGLGPYHERLRNRRRPDEELREEVEEALFYDSWVDAEAITVEVKDGIVTLRGELPSYEEIRYATDDAWDVDGVRGVRSDLNVREGAEA